MSLYESHMARIVRCVSERGCSLWMARAAVRVPFIVAAEVSANRALRQSLLRESGDDLKMLEVVRVCWQLQGA